MSTLQQIRHDITRAWDHVRDGWERLYDQAAGAVTRFTHKGARPTREHGGRGLDLRGGLRVPAWGSTLPSGGWGVLAAEVSDDEDKIVVRLEAPGMAKDDFELQVTDGYLVVRGEKRVEREECKGRYHVTECAYGHFERAIPLPDEVESDKAKASYKKGVLRVEMPKDKARRRQPIKVTVH
jgi:HSP20 family protein